MMHRNVFAEQIVMDNLRGTGRCLLDDLIISLSPLSSTEIFTTVDRMWKEGRVSLRQVSHAKYEVNLSPHLFTPIFQASPIANINHGGFPDQAA